MKVQLKQLKINLNELNQKLSTLSDKLQALNQNINQNVLTEIITEEMLSGEGDMHDLEWLNLIGRVEKNKDKLITLKFNLKNITQLSGYGSKTFKNFRTILEIPQKLILDFSECTKLQSLELDAKAIAIKFKGAPIETLTLKNLQVDNAHLQICLDHLKSTLQILNLSNLHNVTKIKLDFPKLKEIKLEDQDNITELYLLGIENQITKLDLQKTKLNNFYFSKFTSLTEINLNECPNLKGEENKDQIVDLSNSTQLDFEKLKLPQTTQARIVISNDTYLKWQSKHQGTQKWDITKLYQQQGALAIFLVKNGDNFTLVYNKDLTQYKGWGEKEESEIKQYVIQELSKHK